jgi:predicted transcriptional regulator
MPTERPLGELLAERHWTPVMLALAADIDISTAIRIIAGESRPRGTTAVRIAEGLGIGYDRMRRILAATRAVSQASATGSAAP